MEESDAITTGHTAFLDWAGDCPGGPVRFHHRKIIIRPGKKGSNRFEAFGIKIDVSNPSLLLIILGVGGPLQFSMNIGDLMALLSGILFAFGAMKVRESPEPTVFEQLFGFFLYGALVSFALALLPLAALGQPPSLGEIISLVPLLVLLAAGFLIPVMWGIYWGTRQVDPGRLGILLQIEAVVGIGSAALFAGEPFGLRQAIGAVLVISAGLVEVIGNRRGEMEEEIQKV